MGLPKFTGIIVCFLGFLCAAARADLVTAVYANALNSVTLFKYNQAGQSSGFIDPNLFIAETHQGLTRDATTVYAIGNTVGSTDVFEFKIADGSLIRKTSTIKDASNKSATQPIGATIGPDGFLYIASNAINANSVTNIFRVDPVTFAASQYISFPSPVPTGLADPKFGSDGNLYFFAAVASPASGGVWKYNTSSHTVSTLINDNTTGFITNRFMDFGPNGDLFLTTAANGIQEFNPTSGAFVKTLVPAGSGGLATPYDLLFAPDGRLYVDDSQNQILLYNGLTGQSLGTFTSGNGAAPFLDRMVFVPEPLTILPLGLLLLLSARRRANRNNRG